MITGSCHCGACAYTYDAVPEKATSCNCSVCRRHGVLWIYARIDQITVTGPTRSYVWGDKELAFHTCAVCACTTHWENLTTTEGSGRMAVNLLLAEPEIVAGIPVRRFDGADTFTFLD